MDFRYGNPLPPGTQRNRLRKMALSRHLLSHRASVVLGASATSVPSRTYHPLGLPLSTNHPSRSLPLNRGLKPSAAGTTGADPTSVVRLGKPSHSTLPFGWRTRRLRK